MAFILSKKQLLKDLYQAYKDARRHKRTKPYQQRFERHLETNLVMLRDELWSRTYKPRPSSCFLITDPKLREIFAADFRDRIVHHLYYNYVYEMFCRTFIEDSYSCIKGRGTLYGICRLEQHIRQESQNYTEDCYIMKLDIKGYFMHINREKLLNITLDTIDRMAEHMTGRHSVLQWKDIVDIDFVKYLTREIVLLDPTEECEIMGRKELWNSLPHSKSLFHSPKGCGLPIGNLTSQLFSNVYMNVLDQWMKRELRCRHYGRYVDDFYVVSCDKDWLRGLIPTIRQFLKNRLDLELQEGKICICNAKYGVDYLGAYLKPHRRYVSKRTLRRMNGKIRQLKQSLPYSTPEHLRSSLSSILGIMRQHNSYRLRMQYIENQMKVFKKHGYFNIGMTKFIVSMK